METKGRTLQDQDYIDDEHTIIFSPRNAKDKQQQVNYPVEEYVEHPSISSEGNLPSQMLTHQDTLNMDTSYDSISEIEGDPCVIESDDKHRGEASIFIESYTRKPLIMDTSYDFISESKEDPGTNESDDKRRGEASLFIESYTRTPHFIQRLTNLALPTIRFPSKLGLIDNLPDWNLSPSKTYNLKWYMSSNLDKVQVRFVPSESSQISFDPAAAQFRFAGPCDMHYQSIIYIDVSYGSNSDTAILLVYACPDKAMIRDNIELGHFSGEDEHEGVPGTTGVGIYLGNVWSLCNVLCSVILMALG
jgi:hypothetical protein